VAVERGAAVRQMCGPDPEASPVARVVAAPPPAPCDEGELYRCAGSAVVACAEHEVAGICVRGCATEGASLGDDVPLGREAAFAVLCTR
jgi:hypothetical protein